MMGYDNLYALLSPGAAITAGALVSLHCVGMCGPLSCSLIGGKKGSSNYFSHLLYHGGRLFSYALLGSVAGALGGATVSWLGDNPARFAPWAFAAFFLALAFNFDGRLTRWQAKWGIGRNLTRKAYQLNGYKRGLLLGLLTPLIPCGPLYLMFWVSTLSGSAASGALVLACYCVGTMPLMLLAQGGWAWLSVRMNAERLNLLRRGVALIAVGLLCIRAFVGVDAEAVVNGDEWCN